MNPGSRRLLAHRSPSWCPSRKWAISTRPMITEAGAPWHRRHPSVDGERLATPALTTIRLPLRPQPPGTRLTAGVSH